MSEIEILGLIATVFVLLSFLMKRAWKIRIINIIGACFFVVYGLLIGAWSVWLLNAILIIIHLCFLIVMRKKASASENESESESPQEENNRPKSESDKLVQFQADIFNQAALRKQSWFLTAQGDKLTEW